MSVIELLGSPSSDVQLRVTNSDIKSLASKAVAKPSIPKIKQNKRMHFFIADSKFMQKFYTSDFVPGKVQAHVFRTAKLRTDHGLREAK